MTHPQDNGMRGRQPWWHQKLSHGWPIILDRGASVALIVLVAIVGWDRISARSRTTSYAQEPSIPSSLQSLQDADAKGSLQAQVAIIEYSDFQCPFCAQFATQVLPDLERLYIRSGHVMFVFRHLPLEKIHASALEAARFAECAGRHGKFWEVHDEFFRHQQQLASELGPIIRRVNLNPDALNECVKGEAAEKVQRDVDRARALGIKGTPAFLVGRIVQGGAVKVSKILSGARPLEDFENALKPLLSGG